MPRRMALTDAQFVHLFQRSTAAAANNGGTIAADQRIRHGYVASWAIQIYLRFSFLWFNWVAGHYCYTSSRNCCSCHFPALRLFYL
jgi:hypothetical protein